MTRSDVRVVEMTSSSKMFLILLPWPLVVLLVLLHTQPVVHATKDTKVDSLPYFLEPIPNKTVVVGRDVILPCSVDNLKGYKVAWIFVETQTILTIHHTIITKNPRFSLARNDHKHWYLKISDIRPSDNGFYMCQVNSDPMMSQVGFLEVQVPPDIIDDESSGEVEIQEGHDVTLRCKARGQPKPKISWKREDGGSIYRSNGINLQVTDSEVLHIPKVSRLHMGAYLCIASNDVPPSVSKRITLKVHFAPVLWIPNQLIGASLGMDVTLVCHTEAFPRSINYWSDEKGQMILSNRRFDSIVAENGYKSYMQLKIRNVQKEDFASYGCAAKNSFGETSGTIKVYEIPTAIIAPENNASSEGMPERQTNGHDDERGKNSDSSRDEKSDSQQKEKGQKRNGKSDPDGDDHEKKDDNDDDDDDGPLITRDKGVINFDVGKFINQKKGKEKKRHFSDLVPSLQTFSDTGGCDVINVNKELTILCSLLNCLVMLLLRM
ncbi:lachesin-like isoform X2 [Oratosquilla oratoria]|uniref:lachesin-like isoform X2 n=1 Tax=Oratosquilla oratoria TaxID=337810 RepID=UPI003F76C267